MRKLRIAEWIIQIVKSMYYNAHSKVRITNSYSNPINVSVGVHQGSVLIIVRTQIIHQQIKYQESFSAMSHMEAVPTAISRGVDISEIPGYQLLRQTSSQ